MKPLSMLMAGMTLGCLLAAPVALASQALAAKAGCVACHMPAKKLVGPSYKDIAAKYNGRADAMAYLTKRVREGGPGTWGTVPMAPSDATKVSDADLKTLLTWILKTPQ